MYCPSAAHHTERILTNTVRACIHLLYHKRSPAVNVVGREPTQVEPRRLEHTALSLGRGRGSSSRARGSSMGATCGTDAHWSRTRCAHWGGAVSCSCMCSYSRGPGRNSQVSVTSGHVQATSHMALIARHASEQWRAREIHTGGAGHEVLNDSACMICR